tara:strand:+ start:3460 stop:3720 length:261 start_codon:yes stop_codon:yes gene_type:complete
MTGFCELDRSGLGTKCLRCGSWSREGDPSCPPYVTRSEPDNARLPHLRTKEQNNAAYEEWWAEREKENERNLAQAEVVQRKRGAAQ